MKMLLTLVTTLSYIFYMKQHTRLRRILNNVLDLCNNTSINYSYEGLMKILNYISNLPVGRHTKIYTVLSEIKEHIELPIEQG